MGYVSTATNRTKRAIESPFDREALDSQKVDGFINKLSAGWGYMKSV